MAKSRKDLAKSKKEKNDEFYTQLTDIEKEMKYFRKVFENKTVFCNCDDPEYSNFWKYFSLNFDHLKLKKLMATHFDKEKKSYFLEMYRDAAGVHTDIKTLEQNGDFRSPECVELLKEADIVCTNPPFSLFREYVAQLMEYNKKFIILGNQNAISYKEIFPLIKKNKLWYGASIHSGGVDFRMPDDYEDYSEKVFIKDGHHYINLSGIRWFTNIDYPQRHEEYVLYKNYSPEEYPKYDDYDAINVNKSCDIPLDYYEKIGVPISFLDKYCPDQFEIIGLMNSFDIGIPRINGKALYARLVIKRK